MAKKIGRTREQKQAKVVLGNIIKQVEINDDKINKLTHIAGVSATTLNRRREHPEEFKLVEILRIANFYKIDIRELLV